MSWKNRIVGTDEVDPADLLANPLNARMHPRTQEKAVVESLATVGWVSDVIVNRRTGFVVDGHLRSPQRSRPNRTACRSSTST